MPGDPPSLAVRDRSRRVGLAQGVGSCLWWGLLPLYFPLLAATAPVEIIAHRVIWSLLVCLAILHAAGAWGSVRDVLHSRRTLLALGCAGALVATNWLVFVFGVLGGHAVDAALGYYINPPVTAALAVVVVGEPLRPAQWVALGTGAVAVVVLTVGVGRVPWIALTLAATFVLYSLLKNQVSRTVPAVTSLAVETAAMTPVALGYLLWLGLNGAGTSTGVGRWHTVALISAGVVTAVPLLLFGGAARRLPLSVVGMIQYLTPTIQLTLGVLVLHEQMPAARWWGFALVWLALVVLTVDGLRNGRAPRPERDAATA